MSVENHDSDHTDGNSEPMTKNRATARRWQPRSLMLAMLSVAILVIAAPADARVYSVCTVASLHNAADDARPGDVIRMCNGTWANADILFQVRGNASAPITLRAETPGKVVLTGSSRLRISGKFAVVDGLVFKGRYTGDDTRIIQFQNGDGGSCVDCRLTNTSILDYSPSNSQKNTKWVTLQGKRNRVDHCHFRGKTNLGSMLQIRLHGANDPNYHRVDHNLFEDRPDLSSEISQNADTLEVGSQSKFAFEDSRATIEYNYMLNVNSDYEVLTVKSSGNLVQYNVLDSSSGVLSLRQGTNNTVNGNYVFGRGINGPGGIRVTGRGHTIVNNYISDVNLAGIDSKAPISLSTGTNEPISIDAGLPPFFHYEVAEDVTVAHNTIVNSGVGILLGQGKNPVAPRNIDVVGNVLSRIDGSCVKRNSGSRISYADNLCHAGGSSPTGFTDRDPLLSKDSRGIYRPRSNSPVVNGASSTILSDLKDMDGQSRSVPYDLGADEIGNGGTGPIDICDTGPRTYRGSRSCNSKLALKAPDGFTVM